jgi:hypothetical protein
MYIVLYILLVQFVAVKTLCRLKGLKHENFSSKFFYNIKAYPDGQRTNYAKYFKRKYLMLNC